MDESTNRLFAFFPFDERPIDPAKRHAGIEITSNLSISFQQGYELLVMFVAFPQIARWHCRHLGLDGFAAG